jgi:putative ABC transport system substrate-binding protein
MRRREFITLVGGAAAWPLAARAQRIGRKRPLIGFLGGASFETARPTIDAWLEGMRELGYVAGQSIDIEYRFAEGDYRRLPELARQLAELKPDVILAAVTRSAAAAHEAAPMVPIVCPLLSELEQFRLTPTDARPDQNITGIRMWVEGFAAKQVELAREIVPGASRIGLLVNATGPGPSQLNDILTAGARISASYLRAEVRQIQDLDLAFHRFTDESAAAAVVVADSLFFAERHRIAQLAANARIPTVYGIREHVDAGGLASYGVDYKHNFRRAAQFIDRILKGALPSDLPIEFPTRLTLALNLKAARALGLDIPPTLLARADEVIE